MRAEGLSICSYGTWLESCEASEAARGLTASCVAWRAIVASGPWGGGEGWGRGGSRLEGQGWSR